MDLLFSENKRIAYLPVDIGRSEGTVFEPLPDHKFPILYADPPWYYKDKGRAGKRGAEQHYPCAPTSDLITLPVSKIAQPHSVMFMWVTVPFFTHGFLLMNAWGFKFNTVAFTWIKEGRTGKLIWGLGHSTRANAEFCLLGVRGNGLIRKSGGVHSVIKAPLQGHSKKPDETRQRIIQLYGKRKRIELFARDQPEGWHTWGNEA